MPVDSDKLASPDWQSHQPSYDELALEIALRERLLLTIEGRIQWATLLLNSLESLHEPQVLPQSTDVDEFQDAALDALEALEAPSSFLFENVLQEETEVTPRSFSPLLSVQQQAQRPVKTRPSRVPKLSQPKKLLYIRLSSGVEETQLAILTCSVCSRTQFSTLQGLLNHARLGHSIEWASHDACIAACAVPFSPEDDAWKTYEQDGIEVPWGGNVVGLRRLFERAVGVEENSTPLTDGSQPHDAQQRATIVPSTLLSRTLGLHADSPSLAPFLGRAPKRRCIHVYDEEDHVDIITRDDPCYPPGRIDGHLEHPRLRFRMTFPPRSVARPGLDLAINFEAKAATKTEAAEDSASILSNAAASRFHITARVRVEDRSLYLSKERRTQLDSPHQYRWMIAVTAPSYALPVASYLMRVTVLTPPAVSAVPLSVDKQPFAVIGTANDPFLAKVLLEWVGGGKLEVDHWVDLDPSRSSASVLGFDEMIDIELNRNAPLFHVPNRNPPPLPTLDRGLRSGSYTVPQVELSGSQFGVGPSEYPYEQILKDLLPKAPMTLKDVKPRSNIRVPYKLVASPTHLLALVPGKRKAIEWARARTLHARYLEHTASPSSQHTPLTVGDVYAWLEDMSLFPRPAASAAPLPEAKKAKEKEKEGTPMAADLPCPVCGIKKRLHPGYESKSDGVLWTCSVVPKSDQERLTKRPFINLIDRVAPWDELGQTLYGASHSVQPGNVAHTNYISPHLFPAFRYSPHDLVTLSSPELILAVQKTVSSLQLRHLSGDIVKDEHPRFLESKEAVELKIAPAALLAAFLKPFISALIRPALEVAKHDLLVVTSSNTSAHTGKSGRGGRTRKVPFVLTPGHVLRGVKSTFTQHCTATDAQNLRGTTPKEAVGLCLARVGLPYDFGYTQSHGTRPSNPGGPAEQGL
ncbi:hypothetical protein J3A83DRAFT_4204794 [Scleroderma citrinum]